MPTNPRVDAPTLGHWQQVRNYGSIGEVMELVERQIAYLQSAPPQEKVTGELREKIETLCQEADMTAEVIRGGYMPYRSGDIQKRLSEYVAAVRASLAKCETTQPAEAVKEKTVSVRELIEEPYVVSNAPAEWQNAKAIELLADKLDEALKAIDALRERKP